MLLLNYSGAWDAKYSGKLNIVFLSGFGYGVRVCHNGIGTIRIKT